MATSRHKPGRVREVHFADAATLRSLITPEWSEWGAERLITKADIKTFADLTDNHQWIHEDEARCVNESPYGALIAHGFLILALLPGLLPPEPFQVVGYRQRIVRGSDHFRFPAPIFPGDTVHTRVHLQEVRTSKNNRGTILFRDTEVWSTVGTKPAVVCSLQLQYF